MQKRVSVFLVLFFAQQVKSQTYLGCGFTYGYKSFIQEQGVSMFVRLKNKYDVLAGGIIKGDFNGKGGGIGFRYLLNSKRVQPYLSLSSSYAMGRMIDLKSDGVIGKYNVSSSYFIYGETGIAINLMIKEDPYVLFDGDVFFLISANYRHPLNSIHVVFIDGDYSSKAEQGLVKRTGSGFGVSLSIMIKLRKKS